MAGIIDIIKNGLRSIPGRTMLFSAASAFSNLYGRYSNPNLSMYEPSLTLKNAATVVPEVAMKAFICSTSLMTKLAAAECAWKYISSTYAQKSPGNNLAFAAKATCSILAAAGAVVATDIVKNKVDYAIGSQNFKI